ncbi:DUF2934 domain-containing protein [Candidatus Bathyarchaeota archaeon]|nr:MAG: DUF2934 domain-containing protein [Candidatus Bathyarchaeota archaeon]
MTMKSTKLKQASPPTGNREEVAKLAYEKWLSRKAEHGYDVEDWLAAERLLIEELQRRGSQGRSDDKRDSALNAGGKAVRTR